MSLCQNESKTEESIKEAKALCAHSIREAETNCAHSIREAEACCSTAIREVEALVASQASSIQQSHAKGIQCLEEEAVKEESQGQLNFLSACQAILEASPLKSCSMLLASYQVLLGHTLMSHLFNIPQGASPSQQGPAPGASSPPVPGSSPRPKWWHHSPDPIDILPLGEAMSKGILKGPPSSKHWEIMPLHKMLTRSHHEAFAQDTHLVRKTREEYLRDHCPNFNNENTHDLLDIFWHMAESAGLLSSAIYEIQEAWTGWDELQHANHMLRALPKGLKFFQLVSPSESPKVMGLADIHHPDALWHFNGVTPCPWCGKEGQNEGTVVNHLRTMHYKLGLICKKCFRCPSVTSEAIQHHGRKNCQPSAEEGPDESSSSA